MSSQLVLPETAAVYWRPPMDARQLRMRGRLWTATTVAHTLPFIGVAVLMFLLEPMAFPVSIVALMHAWGIPALYARRGAGVLRSLQRQADGPERVAAGLLGDLVGHAARDVHARTGLVPERGRLGVWLVGEAGAVLVTPGGRRVHCFCVHVEDPSLPSGDRIAHLLLALREDEVGFATVANSAFSGAPWRLRRRIARRQRPALTVAVSMSRT